MKTQNRSGYQRRARFVEFVLSHPRAAAARRTLSRSEQRVSSPSRRQPPRQRGPIEGRFRSAQRAAAPEHCRIEKSISVTPCLPLTREVDLPKAKTEGEMRDTDLSHS